VRPDLFEEVMRLRSAFPLPHYAVVDFDNNAIVHDCAEALFNQMALHGDLSSKDFKRYYELLDAGNLEAAYLFCARTLRGLSPAEVHALVLRALADEGLEIGATELFGRTIAKGIAPRESVVTMSHRLQSCGIEVWIVSASSGLVVRSTMSYFDIEATGVIGIRNGINAGILTGEILKPFSIGMGKVACIRKFIHPTVRPLLGIGDSMGDYPMLQYSRLRAVINHGNPLTKIAMENLENGWYLPFDE